MITKEDLLESQNLVANMVEQTESLKDQLTVQIGRNSALEQVIFQRDQQIKRLKEDAKAKADKQDQELTARERQRVIELALLRDLVAVQKRLIKTLELEKGIDY